MRCEFGNFMGPKIEGERLQPLEDACEQPAKRMERFGAVIIHEDGLAARRDSIQQGIHDIASLLVGKLMQQEERRDPIVLSGSRPFGVRDPHAGLRLAGQVAAAIRGH